MIESISTQQVYDEVVVQSELLMRPTTKSEFDAAVSKLEQLAAGLRESNRAASTDIGMFAYFTKIQGRWGSEQRNYFGAYVKASLPVLRKSLALPAAIQQHP